MPVRTRCTKHTLLHGSCSANTCVVKIAASNYELWMKTWSTNTYTSNLADFISILEQFNFIFTDLLDIRRMIEHTGVSDLNISLRQVF